MPEVEEVLAEWAGEHQSSLRIMAPDGASVKIQQIRELMEHTATRDLAASRIIAVVEKADRLTAEAANALLKTLEEPPSYLAFCLLSARPSLLLPTILSRCQVIRLPGEGLSAPSPGAEKRGMELLYLLDHATWETFDNVLAYLRKGKGRWEREEMSDVASWLLHTYRARWRSGEASAMRMIPHVEWWQAQLARHANVGLSIEGLCMRVIREKMGVS